MSNEDKLLEYSYRGDIKQVKQVLAIKNVSVNVQDILSGKTPLHHAVEWGYITILRLLLRHHANTNIPDMFGRTPIFYAGTLKLISILLEHGADLNVLDDMGYTPLHLAVDKGFSKISEVLILDGADVGNSPIHDAIINKHTEIIKLLLEHGADVNIQNKWKRTPLHFATDIEIVKLLIERGADINMKDSFGSTPLFYFIRAGKFDIVKYILYDNLI